MTVVTKNEIMNLLEMKLLYVSTEEIKNKLHFSTVDVQLEIRKKKCRIWRKNYNIV